MPNNNTPEHPKKRDESPRTTTREDWLNTAMDTLLSEGVEKVKVLRIARKLDCARSSFYWFFDSRQQLLDELLVAWSRQNTDAIIERAARPSPTISQSILYVFECWADDRLFNARLDFAVREWARRSGSVRRLVDLADEARTTALQHMFTRFGVAEEEAFIRARNLYFMQIGYYSLDVRESLEQRLRYIGTYIYCFSGQYPTEQELEQFQQTMQERA